MAGRQAVKARRQFVNHPPTSSHLERREIERKQNNTEEAARPDVVEVSCLLVRVQNELGLRVDWLQAKGRSVDN